MPHPQQPLHNGQMPPPRNYPPYSGAPVRGPPNITQEPIPNARGPSPAHFRSRNPGQASHHSQRMCTPPQHMGPPQSQGPPSAVWNSTQNLRPSVNNSYSQANAPVQSMSHQTRGLAAQYGPQSQQGTMKQKNDLADHWFLVLHSLTHALLEGQ